MESHDFANKYYKKIVDIKLDNYLKRFTMELLATEGDE